MNLDPTYKVEVYYSYTGTEAAKDKSFQINVQAICSGSDPIAISRAHALRGTRADAMYWT